MLLNARRLKRSSALCKILLFLYVGSSVVFYSANALANQALAPAFSRLSPASQNKLHKALHNMLEGAPYTILKITPYSQKPDAVYRLQLKGHAHDYAVRLTHRTEYAKQRTAERSQMASDIGVGPQLFYASPHGSIIITAWVEGINCPKMTPPTLTAMVKTLKQFHQTYAATQSFPDAYTIANRCDNRIKEIKSFFTDKATHVLSQVEKALKEMNQALEPHDHLIPIHGDINGVNTILTNQGDIKLIDWGDSVTSDPYDDLGALAFYAALSVHEEENLLLTYLDRPPTAKEKAKLYLKRLQSHLHYILWIFLSQRNLSNPKSYALPQGPFKTESLSQWLRENACKTHHIKQASDATKVLMKGLAEFQDLITGPRYKKALRTLTHSS